MLPTTQEYKISLMIGQDSFRTLEGVEVIPNPNYPDEPWYSTGGLAIVFKIKLNGKLYALKCFYAEANERQERLGLIADYLKQNPSPYFVDFTYLENELWVETANGGEGYPVVLMEWIEGKTLDNYLEQTCKQQNKPALKNLYFQFCNLAWWLQQQPLAHGDLKHDNLIVTPEGKLKLIDYDGMFVPALRGRKANEVGSPCYQHPKRDAYFFDKHLDDFSLLILQLTLLALQQEPALFAQHYNGDGILLKDTDYRNFAQSPIKTTLWRIPEVKIPLLISQLQSNLNHLQTIDLMPLLQDVEWINWLVAGQKNDKNVYEKQRLKELILNGDWYWQVLFITQISKYYPLSERLVDKYQDKWDWGRLSNNGGLPWSESLIEKFKDKWEWEKLSINKVLPWSENLIEQYKDKWNWKYLSGNSALPLSENLVEKFKDKWDWESLCKNHSLPWSENLIGKYNWYCLSKNEALPWSENLIEEYKYEWDWEDLSWNEALPWSENLIEKYEDKWDWAALSKNKALPWSENLIEKYEYKWRWGGDYIEEIFFEGYDGEARYYSVDVFHSGLSNNEALPWSESLIEKFEDKWKWEILSFNEMLPWSKNLIEKYEEKWDWEKLSENPGLPWSENLIEKYKDKWFWRGFGLSTNIALPWSEKLIEKYKDSWEWGSRGLSSNKALPWSLELIEKYGDKLDEWEWYALNREDFIYQKILQPLIDDAFVGEVMGEISENPKLTFKMEEEEDDERPF